VTTASPRPIRRHASDSSEQRKAESAARTRLEKKLGCLLPEKTLELRGGLQIEVDGINYENRTLCEIYCHVGSLKASQRHKIAADILKLLLAEKALGRGKWRKIICLVDRKAAQSVQGRAWLSVAAHEMGIQIEVVTLRQRVRDGILVAQGRQRR
jgi:hypothetical protein